MATESARRRISLGGCEVLVSDVLGFKEPEQGVAKEPRVVSVVEAPFQFVEVGVQMLDRDVVISTEDGPLQETPNVFDRVRVNITVYPFLNGVVHRLMAGVLVLYAVVGRPFVREIGCTSSAYFSMNP